MILSDIKKFCTFVTKTFLKTLKSISSSGTGGLKFLKTWTSSFDNISITLIGPVFRVTTDNWQLAWKTGPIRVTEILSNDEIQVFKHLSSRGANTF